MSRPKGFKQGYSSRELSYAYNVQEKAWSDVKDATTQAPVLSVFKVYEMRLPSNAMLLTQGWDRSRFVSSSAASKFCN